MSHFICTGGCKGVSDKEGNCNTESCPKYGQPLTPCDCTDGNHQASENEEQKKTI